MADQNCNPNATGTLEGYVLDENGMSPLGDGVNVTIYPVNRPEATANVSSQGYYIMNDVPAAIYYASARKDGYPTVTHLVNVLPMPPNNRTRQDFRMSLYGCDVFCGDYTNRCNANCEGVRNDTASCHFFDETVMSICNGKLTGTVVLINYTNEEGWFVNCCEGEPYKLPTLPALIQGTMDNLIKYTRVVTYANLPSNLIIVTWSGDSKK